WTGDCPLHEDDGRCGLQRECGEAVLTSVCRYYPRSPKVRYADECSCANACEGVLELIMSRREPMRFIETPLTFIMPEAEYTHAAAQTASYIGLRRAIIHIVQDRRHSLPQRIWRAGMLCRAISPFSVCGHEDAMADIVRSFESDFDDVEMVISDGSAISVMLDFTDEFDEKSVNLAKYGEGAAEYFRNGGSAASARKILYSKLPDFDVYMEQIMVNHIFYTTFPYSDVHESAAADFLSLCAAYALLRFLALGHAEDISGTESLVDIYASAFRLIECSNFDRRAAAWLHSYSHDGDETVTALLNL
ncbi:MAG: flagellin lysine-N-methylase, partial [Eubacteriales bacterium]